MAEPKLKPSDMQESSTEPNWVGVMHSYFRQHGFFRAQDLQRVLGDPRDHVAIQSSDEEPINFIKMK